MRLIALLAAVLALLVAPLAIGQESDLVPGEVVWTGIDGRLRLDLSDVDLRAYPPVRDLDRVLVVVMPPAPAADGGTPFACYLRTAPPPAPRDEVVSQAVANEMTRLADQLDQAGGRAGSRLAEQDGVLSAYDDSMLTDPRSSENVRRVRRHFFLADGNNVRMFTFMCIAYESAGEAAVASLPGLVDRLRISGAETP